MLKIAEAIIDGDLQVWGGFSLRSGSNITTIVPTTGTANSYTLPPLPGGGTTAVLTMNSSGVIGVSTLLNTLVLTSGTQTIGGQKTFSTIPVLPASDPTTLNQATRKNYVDNLDAANVKLTGDQTIAGTKTFSTIPVLPASNPTTDNQAVRKAYVDSLNTNNVKTDTNQTITGVKTFSSAVIFPGSPLLTEGTLELAVGGLVGAGTGNQFISLVSNSTMPEATTLGNGRVFTIRNNTAGSITLSRTGTNTFLSGSAETTSLTLTAGETITLYGDKAAGKWIILSAKPTALAIAEGGTGATTALNASRNLQVPFSTGVTTSSNTSLTASDNGKVYRLNTSGGNVTMTLPPINDVPNGFYVSFIKASAANEMRIKAETGETIGNINLITQTNQYACISIIAIGNNYFVQSNFNGVLIQ